MFQAGIGPFGQPFDVGSFPGTFDIGNQTYVAAKLVQMIKPVDVDEFYNEGDCS